MGRATWGRGVAVSLARLVADSDLVRDMLHMCECECEVPEKHISLQGVDIEMISMYAKLLSSGEVETSDGDRTSLQFANCNFIRLWWLEW